MSLYPSLEDMKVDQMAKVKTAWKRRNKFCTMNQVDCFIVCKCLMFRYDLNGLTVY